MYVCTGIFGGLDPQCPTPGGTKMAHWIWSSCVRRSCRDPHWAMLQKNSGEFSLSNSDRWTVETPKDPARILHLVFLSGFSHPKYLLEMQERISDTLNNLPWDVAGIERAPGRIGLLSRFFGARECWDCAYEADGVGMDGMHMKRLRHINSPIQILQQKACGENSFGIRPYEQKAKLSVIISGLFGREHRVQNLHLSTVYVI